ncbi:MAG TPA: hypothetical protein VME63_07445 [Dyella sp.]|uniref:hypothetical protein n=1 Tax=Dyella sp. TaxID=1869338 RepID=UPI002C992693|nr:hypothetical protein [Dyella sp.]HTV85223.1 hypothetical protein [Dyella sp.]
MRKPAVHTALTPRTLQGLGRLLLALLFVLSVFELAHLPAAASHGLVDLWRGAVAGSLFLFFCFPAPARPRADP